jgi:Tol biopolymer transport system component
VTAVNVMEQRTSLRTAIVALPFASLVAAVSIAANAALLKDRIIFARLAPSTIGLFVADANGQNERPLLPPDTRDYNASFSRDGQWIVFTSERAGSADVYRVHLNGSGLERLTDDPAFDDQGSLSPDGRTLAFVSTRAGGKANVWLMDLATRQTSRLTHSDSGNFRPTWSPDGQWIAFSSDRDTPHRRMVMNNCCGWELMQFTSIYIICRDGSGLRRLTLGGASAGSPTWSEDGKRLAFYESSDGQAAPQIVSIDVESGTTRPETSTADGKLSPHFLKDGAIAFTSMAGSQRRVTTTAGVQGPPGQIANPAWSPDGRLVVYSKTVAPQNREPVPLMPTATVDPRFDMYTNGNDPFSVRYSSGSRKVLIARNQGERHWIESMNVDGADRHELFTSPDAALLLGAIAWSRDEKQIAFTLGRLASRHPVTPSQIAIVRSDGSGFRVLTNGTDSSAYPSFSPDGTQLVYRVLGQEQGLRIMSLENGRVTRVTSEWDNFPAWSPRGDRIAFTSLRNGDFEIYTVKLDGTDVRQLTADHGTAGHPVWSPDGRSILFTSSRMGWKDEVMLAAQGAQTYGELFVIRADGSGVRQLTDNQWEEAPSAWLAPLHKP